MEAGHVSRPLPAVPGKASVNLLALGRASGVSVMTDMYETRHDWDYWQAQQEAALDALGFTWSWWLDRVMERGIAEMADEA